MRRPLRRSWIVSFAAAILVALLVLISTRGRVAFDVQTVPVSTGPVEHQVVATGTLQAVATVDVGSQVSGIVQSLDADYNSLVHAGDVVARLDPSVYDAALREARAGVAQAQAHVRDLQSTEQAARTTLLRDEMLASRDLIPQADLDAARAAMAAATADVKGAESAAVAAEDTVRSAAIDLDHTIIRAPVDGVVMLRNVEVGQTLTATLQSPVLYRIAVDLREMQLWVEVDESDIADVRRGEAATFTVESYGNDVFQGRVSQVRLQPVLLDPAASAAAAAAPASSTSASTAPASPVVSVTPTVTSYTTIVDVANPDERLRPGMTATVILNGSRHEEAVRVPNAALAFQPPADARSLVDAGSAAIGEDGEVPGGPGRPDGKRELWRYDRGRLTPVAVNTGLAGGGWTEILSAVLQPGDQVATGVVARRVSWLSDMRSKTSTWIP